MDVNRVSDELCGGTPLHLAYGIGENNMGQYLIDHGADLEVTDKLGRKLKDYEY